MFNKYLSFIIKGGRGKNKHNRATSDSKYVCGSEDEAYCIGPLNLAGNGSEWYPKNLTYLPLLFCDIMLLNEFRYTKQTKGKTIVLYYHSWMYRFP